MRHARSDGLYLVGDRSYKQDNLTRRNYRFYSPEGKVHDGRWHNTCFWKAEEEASSQQSRGVLHSGNAADNGAETNHDEREVEFAGDPLHDQVRGYEHGGDQEIGDRDRPVELDTLEMQAFREAVWCPRLENADKAHIPERHKSQWGLLVCFYHAFGRAHARSRYARKYTMQQGSKTRRSSFLTRARSSAGSQSISVLTCSIRSCALSTIRQTCYVSSLDELTLRLGWYQSLLEAPSAYVHALSLDELS